MKCLFYIFALALTLLLVSCNTSKTAFVISLHEFAYNDIYSESRLNRGAMVQGINKQANIKALPFVDYHDFYSGEVYFKPERPTRFGVRLHLDDFGKDRIMQECVEHEGMTYAIVVDGFYVGEGTFDLKSYETGVIELPPLWGEHEARNIADHVEKNFDSSELNYFFKR